MRCTNCGYEGPGAAQCPSCKHWNTLVRYQPLADVPKPEAGGRFTSGVDALDELLGGGLRRGVVYRLSGDPGAGKSTLALDVCMRIARATEGDEPTCLYVCGEEAPENVRHRAEERLGAQIPTGLVVGQDECVEDLTDLPPSLRLVVVDSLNAWRSPRVAGDGGSNGQMIHAVRGLARLAESTGCTIIALSHVNSDGEGAGAVAINHWVDATLVMRKASDEDEAGTLKVTKNRHGRAPLSVDYTHVEKGLEFHGEP